MSFDPKFLTYDQVVSLHQMQIEQFCGSHGIRDDVLLLSALAQPKSGFENKYFHKDFYEMAAAYLFHLVKNHPFYDGNKRIAALVAAVFLQINGLVVTASEDDFEKIVLDATQGFVNKNGIAEFFRKNTNKSKRKII